VPVLPRPAHERLGGVQPEVRHGLVAGGADDRRRAVDAARSDGSSGSDIAPGGTIATTAPVAPPGAP
jgi:hypothetical protein